MCTRRTIETFVRAIALSISSVPVASASARQRRPPFARSRCRSAASPYPHRALADHPRRHLMTGLLARARGKRGETANAVRPLFGAIALSISSVQVAAPAPGHDLPPPPDDGAPRAHEKTRRVRGTRVTHRGQFKLPDLPGRPQY